MTKSEHISVRIKSSGALHILVIAAAALVVYLQTLSFGLVYCDDHELILKDSGISELSLTNAMTKGYINTSYYRPVTTLSFMIDFALGGQSALPYHITNMILHVLFCISLYYLLRKLGIKPWKSLAAVLIFSVHPLLVNSVAWIAGRNDMLYGLFCLLAFIFLIEHIEKGSRIYLLLHFMSLFLAFLSKETALVFPAVMFMYMILFKERRHADFFRSVLPAWVVEYAVYFLLRSESKLGTDVNIYGLNVFVSNLRQIPEYIAKTFLPVNLSVLSTYGTFNTIAGLLIIIAITALAANYLKISSGKAMLLGAIWFLLLIIPNLFVRLKNAADWNDYLDSRAYLPLAGMIITLTSLNIDKIKSMKPSYKQFAVVAIVFLLAFQSVLTCMYYSNAIRFYENAVNHDGSRPLFHYILAKLYESKGKTNLAEDHIIAACELRKNSFTFNYYAGDFYFSRKNFSKAVYFLGRADSIEPWHQNACNRLAYSFASLGSYSQAIDCWEKMIKKWPYLDVINDYLALAYLKSGNYDKSDFYSDIMKDKKLNTKILSMEYYKAGWEKYKKSDFPLSLRLIKKSYELDTGNVYAASALRSIKTIY